MSKGSKDRLSKEELKKYGESKLWSNLIKTKTLWVDQPIKKRRKK